MARAYLLQVMAVAERPCPSKRTEVALAELVGLELSRGPDSWEVMAVAKLHGQSEEME